MNILIPSKEQIREIAEQLETGVCGYWNKVTGELIFMPDFEIDYNDQKEFWKEELAKFKKYRNNFVHVAEKINELLPPL